jgi:hypothetical protein
LSFIIIIIIILVLLKEELKKKKQKQKSHIYRQPPQVGNNLKQATKHRENEKVGENAKQKKERSQILTNQPSNSNQPSKPWPFK